MGFDIPNRTPLDYLSISLSHSESLECMIVSVLDGVNIPVYSGTDPYTLQNLLLALPLSKSYCHCPSSPHDPNIPDMADPALPFDAAAFAANLPGVYIFNLCIIIYYR